MSPAAPPSPWRFNVAPMMDWTTSYCRQFHRQLSRHTRLYTEMVTTGALLHGDADRFLQHDPAEHPVALQLGGSEPDALARGAALGAAAGFDEINLNCGCPSDRVQEGRFGACLMREPERVAASVSAMQRAVDIPVTVKHRIGVDDSADYAFMRHFVSTVAAAGCQVFIVHARKAWLQGLSPRENRDVPPLTYEHVYRLKQDFPELTIVINGGIETLEAAATHLSHVDGVMLGRTPYEQPWLLADVDARLFGAPNPVDSREAALLAMTPLLDTLAARDEPANRLTRHLLGLYRGQPGGRAFRRYLSTQGNRPQGGRLLQAALEHCRAHAATAPSGDTVRAESPE
jgi:tRNA-dihydrouridine synthase A